MKALCFSLILAGLSGVAGAASAATCANSRAVEARLETKFGERLTYVGQGRENHEVLVYASAKTGRWTMLVATPDGYSCLIATGRGEASLDKRMGKQTDVVFR